MEDNIYKYKLHDLLNEISNERKIEKPNKLIRYAMVNYEYTSLEDKQHGVEQNKEEIRKAKIKLDFYEQLSLEQHHKVMQDEIDHYQSQLDTKNEYIQKKYKELDSAFDSISNWFLALSEEDKKIIRPIKERTIRALTDCHEVLEESKIEISYNLTDAQYNMRQRNKDPLKYKESIIREVKADINLHEICLRESEEDVVRIEKIITVLEK